MDRLEDDNQVEELMKAIDIIENVHQVEEPMKDIETINSGRTNEPEHIDHLHNKKEIERNGLGSLISSSRITRSC